MKFDLQHAILESQYGAIAIDLEGKIIYINQQCASIFQVECSKVLGKHIREVFPGTKMIEGLQSNEPRIVFYNEEYGFAVSTQTPIYSGEEKIGLFEADAIQNNAIIFEIYEEYTKFLNDEFGKYNKTPHEDMDSESFLNALVGNSIVVMEMKEKIILASKTNSTVIITGETGTGKEIVANAIHHLSRRRDKRLVKINAAALPANLVESELFGYEKGSFTGALKEGKKGKFEQADGGTLFIDEINQMPLSIQPKLLRTLEELEVDRIGGTKSISVDVRIIAASNESLETLVREKKFREDLYYRINVFEVRIPPLRNRANDLDELISYMIVGFNRTMGKTVKGVDDYALSALKKYPWPGNIRELRNKVEQAMHYCNGDLLMLGDFRLDQATESFSSYFENDSETISKIEVVKRNAEKDLILSTLQRFGGNKSRAANYLGIARPQLYAMMHRLGIQ